MRDLEFWHCKQACARKHAKIKFSAYAQSYDDNPATLHSYAMLYDDNPVTLQSYAELCKYYC